MANFYENLKELCDKTGSDVSATYMKITGALPADFKRKCERGWVPDSDTLENLAAHFGVGVSDLSGKQPGGSLAYLAGPISGFPDYLERHQKAKAYLEEQGHAVISPAVATKEMPVSKMTYQMFLDHGLLLLSFCDTLFLMPGWDKSSGCQMEYAYAKANGYQIHYLHPEELR